MSDSEVPLHWVYCGVYLKSQVCGRKLLAEINIPHVIDSKISIIILILIF